jgi:predicted DNA-binding transcriptional regulator AlpA
MAPRIPRDQISTYEPLPPGAAAAQRPDIRRTSRHQRYGNRSSGDQDAARYLTGPQLCARYSISDMSLWRWLQDAEIRFPRPALRVRDRRYWLEADLIAWERAQIPRGDDCNRPGKAQHFVPRGNLGIESDKARTRR